MIECAVQPERGLPIGMFRFAVLPRPGDRIAVSNPAGGADVLDVLYVLHNPSPVPSRPFADQKPIVTVVVRLRESA